MAKATAMSAKFDDAACHPTADVPWAMVPVASEIGYVCRNASTWKSPGCSTNAPPPVSVVFAGQNALATPVSWALTYCTVRGDSGVAHTANATTVSLKSDD